MGVDVEKTKNENAKSCGKKKIAENQKK